MQNAHETGRTKITDAVYQWFAELQLFQGKDQQGKSEKTLRAYHYRLGFFLDFTAQKNLRFVDQIDCLRTSGRDQPKPPAPPLGFCLVASPGRLHLSAAISVVVLQTSISSN